MAKGASRRVVLLFEIWRPEIGEAERAELVTLFEAVDLFPAQHGAAADPGACAAVAYRLADAVGPVRRIERNLDGVITRFQQRIEVAAGLARGDPAQDRHQRQPERRRAGAHRYVPIGRDAAALAVAAWDWIVIKMFSVGGRGRHWGEARRSDTACIAWRG